MMDLKTYGYTEIEAIPDGLLPGRVTELRRERFTVMTELGEVTAVLKGAFYRSAETRADFPCVGDLVLLHYNESGDSLIVTVLPRRSKFSRADYSGHAAGYAKTIGNRSSQPTLTMCLSFLLSIGISTLPALCGT